MTYCVKCGAENKDGAKFCSYCGEPMPNEFGDNQLVYEGDVVDTHETVYEEPSYQEMPQEDPFTTTQDTQSYSYDTGYEQPYDDGTGEFFPESVITGNKGMAVLSYLGILLLIPLLAANKNSPYVKHHLNQGIALFVANAIVDLLLRYMKNIAMFSWCLRAVNMALFIIMIMGIISAVKGTRRPLPFMDNIQVFK